MYYRLRQGCSLRGWLFKPYALVRDDWYSPTDLSVEDFNVLVRCDGQTAFAENESDGHGAILARYVNEGVIEECADPSPIADSQHYHLYPCWRFNLINWALTGQCNYSCGCRALALAATDDLLAADPTHCIYFREGYYKRFAQLLDAHGVWHVPIKGDIIVGRESCH